MKTKLSARFWCALSVFSLIGQVAWVVENMYFNVFIYNMFNATAGDISIMVGASAVSATLTTVFMGALSDRVGKRKLFICGGYILWGVSILSFSLLRTDVLESVFPMAVSGASLGISLTITLDCVMTFFGSSANDAAFNAWVTDSTDSSNRGAAEGVNAMMPLLAILVVFGGCMFFDLSKTDSWTLIFTIIGAVVILVGIAGLFLIKDPDIARTETNYFENIVYGFRPGTVRKNPILYLTLAAFSLFNISIQVFMPYLIIYYERSLGMSDYVLIMAPAIILAAVFTAIWGGVYDKKGFGWSVCVSLLLLCSGYVILLFTSTKLPVFIGSLLMMCGYLASMAVFGAAVRDRTPKGKAGMFQGLRIFAQVLIPGVVGPFVGAFVLSGAQTVKNSDGTESFLPNANVFAAALGVIILLLPLLFFLLSVTKDKLKDLYTPFEKEIDDIPFSEYPRPTLVRDSYICLNGKWNLKIERKSRIVYDGEVTVPYPVESRISGVQREVKKDDILVYERDVTLSEEFFRGKVILHFGAVDQFAEVFVNGVRAGSHEGGYIPFEFDITPFVKCGDNSIRVNVRDPLDTELPYGKQSKKRGGMWYTKTSGIWKTVWLESTVSNAIECIDVKCSLTSAEVTVVGAVDGAYVIFEGAELPLTDGRVTLSPKEPIAWTPASPELYDFEIVSGEDNVRSYFALRTVEVRDGEILLNGKPYFFHGVLDQGYYSDGIYTPATPKGYENDILSMKALGFNMLRKHIKIEPELFYYYCDKYGMVVFQDIVNSGKYSFIIDTALPTLGLKRGISHKASERRRAHFEDSVRDTVELLKSHPCVCEYTIFNEGWGQYDADRLYEEFKALDGSRIWDATSGWFCEQRSDFSSEHVYYKPIKLKKGDRPLFLSEFGGYSMKIEGHSANLKNAYGYRFYNDVGKYKRAILSLYRDEIIPAIKESGLCAAVLTQLSDVEDETNGLLTYDRAVMKVDEKEMNAIAEELILTFDSVHTKR